MMKSNYFVFVSLIRKDALFLLLSTQISSIISSPSFFYQIVRRDEVRVDDVSGLPEKVAKPSGKSSSLQHILLSKLQ